MEGRISGDIRSRRLGGLLLAAGGLGFAVAGALHPQPGPGTANFHDAMTAMLSHPLWPASHWTGLVAGLVLVWSIWLLMDSGWADGSLAATAGARMAIIGTLFMSVQWAVEIAAAAALGAHIAGQASPMIGLVDAMQAVGWPALGLGFGLLAFGVVGSAPRWVRIAGVVGAVAVGLAGLLAQGLHIMQAGVLFLGGHLLALWMIWAGVRAARGEA